MLNEFIDYLISKVGCPYIWGGQGTKLTKENYIKIISAKEALESNRKKVTAFVEKIFNSGKTETEGFDCSGLGMCFLQNLKGIYKKDMTADNMMNTCESISKSKLRKGDWVFKTDGEGSAYHIGYVVDDDLNVVEAQGRNYGVVKRALSKGGWSRYGRPEIFKAEIEANAKLQPTIKRGDSGAMVKLLQQTLIAKGYELPKYGADGDFGAETEEAVKAFQKSNGLVVDGIVGAKTIAALEAKTEKWTCGRNLKLTSPYMRGEDVKAVQNALDKLDYAVGQIDGIFGKRTDEAVRAFQKRKGLTVDGIAGKKTITALGGVWED